MDPVRNAYPVVELATSAKSVRFTGYCRTRPKRFGVLRWLIRRLLNGFRFLPSRQRFPRTDPGRGQGTNHP
jgi:hypothetical protein